MKIAFIIFDGMTALDFVGVYDAVTRLKTMGFIPDLEWELCAQTDGPIFGSGLRFTPTRVGQRLEGYGVIIVPSSLVANPITWLKTAGDCLKVSVCTGAILLGAAGYLKGRKATTHPSAFDELRPFCNRSSISALSTKAK